MKQNKMRRMPLGSPQVQMAKAMGISPAKYNRALLELKQEEIKQERKRAEEVHQIQGKDK
jgi:hypothetical protein